MSFTRAIRDALAVVADALIPVEVADLAEWLADQAEMLAKAKERREVWEPGEIEPGEIEPGEIDFTAAGLAAARAVRDAFTIVVEVIDALIPAEATDQAEMLAKAEEGREVWEPGEIDAIKKKIEEARIVAEERRNLGATKCLIGGEFPVPSVSEDEQQSAPADPHTSFAACGGDADAGSSHPTSAPSAKQRDAAPHTDSETPPLGTPGGETPRSAAGHPPGHLTSYDASWAAAIVQSRGLDLPLGSRARAAVMSLAERLQALADAEAERDAWEPVELTLHHHPPAAHPKRFSVGTESPAAAMNLDVNITDPADRWDQ